MPSPRWKSADAVFTSWLEAFFSFEERGVELHPGCLELMRYSMMAPGKHFRPVLFLLTLESLGLPMEQGRRGSLALECVHTYSLIHDDLPCMDDDDFRRGQPSCHKRFGEAQAVLAGDALLTLAFELLGGEKSGCAARMALILARASGAGGMVAGQLMDLESEGKTGSVSLLEDIHDRKTGALIGAAMAMAGAQALRPDSETSALDAFGRLLGRVFQVRDDILDVVGDEKSFGKSIGKDAAQKKFSAPALMGLEAAEEYLEKLLALARTRMAGLSLDPREFGTILDYLGKRER